MFAVTTCTSFAVTFSLSKGQLHADIMSFGSDRVRRSTPTNNAIRTVPTYIPSL